MTNEDMKKFEEQHKEFLNIFRNWLIARRDSFDVKGINCFTMICMAWLDEINGEFLKNMGLDPDTTWQ